MATQAPQLSFPQQVVNRLGTDPLAVPGLIARFLLPDQDKVRAQRREQETATFLKALGDQDERFKTLMEDYATRIVPANASAMAGIQNHTANQEVGRAMALDNARTQNIIDTARVAGDVNIAKIGATGKAAEGVQGVVNQGQIGVAQAQGTNRVNEIGALTTGAVTVGDAEAQNDITRMRAQEPILKSAQGHDLAILEAATNFGRYAIDSQRGAQRDILARQAAMNKQDTFDRLTGFIGRLAPLAALFVG